MRLTKWRKELVIRSNPMVRRGVRPRNKALRIIKIRHDLVGRAEASLEKVGRRSGRQARFPNAKPGPTQYDTMAGHILSARVGAK